jgi:hypothetical protein
MSRRMWVIGWFISTIFALNAVLLLWRRRWQLSHSTADPIVPLPPVTVVVPLKMEAETPPASDVVAPASPRRRWPLALDNTLFLLSGLLFLATRLIGLEKWPIYFFTDEAINPLLAADFIRHGFTDGAGQWFPTYFANGQYLSLSVSVYAQVVPYLLFGFSVFVTRAVSVLVALSGTLAIGLILKDSFKLRFWWLGTLILSIIPAWFLHSRTAFEHVMWVGFYAWFLYFYLRYRQGQPRHILTAFVFGALSFYSYSGALSLAHVSSAPQVVARRRIGRGAARRAVYSIDCGERQ